MKQSWFLLALVLVAEAHVQPCSPIRFNVLPVRTIAQSSSPVTGSGLLRQADGSFRLHEYRRTRPDIELTSFVKGEVIPNLERELFGCSGQMLGPLTPSSNGRPFAPLAGVSSTEILVTNLTGDNRPSMIVFDRFAPQDTVVVGLFDESITLQTTTAYPTGRNPFHALAGDFNGDGLTDVGVVFHGDFGANDGGISVLLGNGDGTLQEAVNLVTGEIPTSATAAMLNADDFLDIAVSHNNERAIKILFGQADGTFGAPVTVETSDFPSAVAAARINGDAFDDLVFATSGGAGLLLSDGAGGFAAGAAVDGGLNPAALAAGDLNNDGRIDLALGDVAGKLITAVLGNGAGGFGPPVRYPGGPWPGALFIQDFDGDGNADLVSATGHPDALTWLPLGGTVAVLRGKGDGTFFGAESLFGGGAGSSVVAGDFNRDGNQDLAVSRQGGIALALGRGDGSFGKPETVNIQQISGPAGPQQLAAGDLNNDQNPDLVVVTASGSSGLNNVWSLLGNGDGTFRPPVSTATVHEPGAVLATDLNNDNRDDVIVLGSNGFRNEHGYAVHLSNASGTPGPAQTTLFENTVRPLKLAAGDLNGDQGLDLFIVDGGSLGASDGGVLVLLGNGSGGFGAASKLAAGSNPRAVTVADVNGDSALDLLVTSGVPETFAHQLLILPGNGDGSFRAPQSLPVEFGPGEVIFEDFSGDGNGDLIVLHCCGDVAAGFLLGAGDGTFEPEVSFFAGGDPLGRAAADFNNDGLTDLAISSGAQGASAGVALMLNVANTGPRRATVVNAVINAASGVENPLAPGEFVTVFGEDLGPAESVSGFEKGLGGTRVFVNGVECFVSFTSRTQVNAVLTAQLPTNGQASVVVEYEGASSAPRALALAPASPGIFTQEFGLGQAWVVNQDGSFNSAGNPAARGSVVAFFATGQGVTDPVLTDGEQPVSPTFPKPVLEVSVTIGGQPAPPEDILFAGLIFNGVLQVNVRVAAGVAPGPDRELILSIGGSSSRAGVTVAVE